MRRWLRADSARQSVTVANLLSSSKALTYIGSDEGELFHGDTLRERFEKYSNDQAVPWPENIKATGYEAGDFGWAYTTLTIQSPEADLRVAFRNTFIFSMEVGVWRIVHVHNSNPKPNFEAMGYELGPFEDLLDVVRAEQVESTQTGIAPVMFTDIVDSTALACAVGYHKWNRIVTDHIGAITGQGQAEGGTMVKSLRDGALSTFASVGVAMRTAIAIQQGLANQTNEPKLRIRIGIHTGDIIQNDGDFFGTVVNKAARVAAMCEPENIRVSEATRVMVGDADGFAFSDPDDVPLKGLTGEHLIHSLKW